MVELFRDSYYFLDLLIGYGAPLLFLFLYKTGRISSFSWRFYWVGFLIGLAWEVPIFVLSAECEALPIVVWNRPFPCHYLVFMLSHTFWDGWLFVVGIWLARLLLKGPHFQKFRWAELMVFLAWGQFQELLVEISSTFNDGWSFVEYWWNPAIFTVNGHPVTWLMQVIWAAGSILYYFLVLRYWPAYQAGARDLK